MGVSDELDAFLVAFLIFPCRVAVAAGSFASAFMPLHSRPRTARTGRVSQAHEQRNGLWIGH